MLIITFTMSFFILYKEIKYYNSLELLTNENPSKINLLNNSQNLINRSKEMFEDDGKLKTINLTQTDLGLNKEINSQLTNLLNEENTISEELKKLKQKSLEKSKEKGIEAGKKILSTTFDATSHFLPITKRINYHLKSIGSKPPKHLTNHPTLPNYDPSKANSWWIPQGNTPEFYFGNYIPIAAANCTQVQCAPDGYAEAN